MTRQQPAHVDATFYAQVEPRWKNGAYWTDVAGHPILESAKVVALTQERPRKPRSGVVIVKLTLRMPAGAFLPLAPEAVVVIPADLTDVVPVEVTATDPREEEDPDA